jgi:hypothetical protein
VSLNPDGTAECDRCRAHLAGFGVLYGLVCSRITPDGVETLIFCYVNGCRTVALDGLVNVVTSPDDVTVRCSDCGLVMADRSLATAMLATDLDASGEQARYLQLCYVTSAKQLLANVGRPQ